MNIYVKIVDDFVPLNDFRNTYIHIYIIVISVCSKYPSLICVLLHYMHLYIEICGDYNILGANVLIFHR